MLVFFGEKNWGKVTDIHESGMRFQFAHAPKLHKRTNFALQAMGSVMAPGEETRQSFEALGEVVWAQAFERNAGVRFEGFADGTPEQFQRWLSLEAPSGAVACDDNDTSKLQAPAASHEAIETRTRSSETLWRACADTPTHHWEVAEAAAKPSQESDSEFAGEVVGADELVARSETPTCEREQSEHTYNTKSRITRAQLLAAATGLAVIAVIGGVCMSALRRAHAAGSRSEVPANSAQPGKPAGQDYGRAAQSSRPFVVEVSDASNNSWLLRFPEDSTKNALSQPAHNSNVRSASSASISGIARPKYEAAKKKLPDEFKLMAPIVRQPSANPSSLSAMSAVPVPSSESSPAPAVPLGAAAVGKDAGSAPSAPGSVGGQVQPARLVRAEPPQYPEFASSNRIEGEVTMDAFLDATGKVTDVKVVSGPVALRQAAVSAIRRWRYEPTRLNGKPIASHVSVTMKFHTDQGVH